MYIYKIIGQKNASGFKKGKNWIGFYKDIILIRAISFNVQSIEELEAIVDRLNDLQNKLEE
ncbi:MAG: hypothetical protein WC888_05575 [Candidatus Izemoplasmatales bacterium]|jgi:hypothetical protein